MNQRRTSMKLHAAAPTFLLFLGRFSSSKSHDLSVVAEDRPTCNRCRLTATVPSLEREKTIQLEIIRNRVISKARSKVVNFCPTETEKASIIIGDGAVSCLFMPNAMMIHKNLVIKKTPPGPHNMSIRLFKPILSITKGFRNLKTSRQSFCHDSHEDHKIAV